MQKYKYYKEIPLIKIFFLKNKFKTLLLSRIICTFASQMLNYEE